MQGYEEAYLSNDIRMYAGMCSSIGSFPEGHPPRLWVVPQEHQGKMLLCAVSCVVRSGIVFSHVELLV